MRIKKLSVVGFKSFMDKTEIPFPIGISAVVGPNGCGKSNIVDAIRWAMGEQSAKQLRGRQMEDVIFNGAGDFKPLGMAEVSIVLENGDGSFPPEFENESEISITRRLYRSGESEYLLNGVQCRLKDVQELFMDTGLGNRAYSIIGQGRIGSIVEQRPEETRVMIEEAAGITKYKKKEAEARRKMELTQVNLQRVEDILIEVENQMRSLKRQAAKATRYKSVGKEIQRLEMILNANSYHELKEESGTRIKSTEDLVQQELALATDISVIQSGIETMNLDLDDKDREIAALRNRYLNVKDDYTRKESVLESLASEKRMQTELEARLNQEKEDIRRRVLTLGEERAGLQEKSEKLKQDSGALESQIPIAEERLQKRKTLLNEIKDEYENINARVSSAITREAGLNQESGYLNKRIAEITDNRARLEKEKGDAGRRIEELLETSSRKNEVRDALTAKLQDIERDILERDQRSGEFEQIKKGLETNLKTADADLNICRTRLSSLISLNENFEGYQMGVRTIMKARDFHVMDEGRVLGLVADVIQVEGKYEQAVEAILGDKLQYIIVEKQEDGRDAVIYLKSRAKGKGSFIPVKSLNTNGADAVQNGFTLIRDVISVSESYRPIINTLLGNAAVAEDLDQAISAWKGSGCMQSFVTLDGDVVDRSGIISGGKLVNSSHSLLSRKREIKELQEKDAKLAKDVEGLRARIVEIEQRLEDEKVSLGTLRNERQDCQDKLNEIDKVIFRLSHELDQTKRTSDRIAADLTEKEKEHTSHKVELEKIESELKSCGEDKRQREEYLLKKRLELKECEEEFEDIRNELAKLKMDLGLAQEEQKGILREIERIESYSEESTEKIEKIARDIISVREKQSEYLTKEEEIREELKAFYDKMQQAEEALNQAQYNRNNYHAEIREHEKKSEVLREELDAVKEKISMAKLEQSEIRIKMDNLAEQARERFNINLPESYKEYLEADFSAVETKNRLEHQKVLRERLGDVNLTAIQEHEALKERHEFIQKQKQDLLNSIDSIMQAIRKINKTCLDKFMETFNEANQKIKQVFPILFNGGEASLRLTDEKNPLESGVLVEVRPPGKKLSHMGLLSGGEKALVAMSLLFAIYLIKPSPFCLLDEVDAPLDEANVDRFNNLLLEIRKYSQVLMVTHNRRSMEIVDSLFGVTMERAGISKMVAVNLNVSRSN
jgi:chromosome segregation protein